MELVENVSNIPSNDLYTFPLDRSLDDYDVSIKISFAIIGIFFIVICTIALAALNKTRQTPATARFLSSGLIIFDVLTVSCYTVRKFVDNHDVNMFIQITGTGFCVMAYTTVGVMSLERLVIFYSPHLYLRLFTLKIIKTVVCTVWTVMFGLYFFIRFGVCYFVYPNFTMYNVVTVCNTASFLFYGVILVVVVIISAACYVKIFLIIRSDKRHTNEPHSLSATAKRLQSYKSTSLVFVYIMTIFITTIAYAFTISLNLATVPLRLANDATTTFNCVMDPCMYIIWYSECRMEMLKMIARCIPTLTPKIEKMRVKIFDIVTIENGRAFRSNSVHPF